MPELFDTFQPGALMDREGIYRYDLWRVWDPALPRLGWLMLNPSTADASADDPTLRRCMGFARQWGYGGVTLRNLFAFRASDPRTLVTAPDPVGPLNDQHLTGEWPSVTMIVAGWGGSTYAQSTGRARHVAELMGAAGHRLHCLGVTKSGQPLHPLYQPSDSIPRIWAGQVGRLNSKENH